MGFLAAMLGALACGGSTAVSTASQGHGDAGEVPDDGGEPSHDAGSVPVGSDASDAAFGCGPALATPNELAATPRADVNLELLALKLSPGRIVANEVTYQRVVRDITAIRATRPDLAGIKFFASHDGKSITLTVPVDTSMQMQSGGYHAWDCLNQTYGATMPFEYVRIGAAAEVFVFAKLEGIYATNLLAAEYGRLPGVTHAEGDGVGGDGPTICATTGDAVWHYVFDAAGGDCPAGCTEHAYSHFTTASDGAVTALETFSTMSGMPRPAWVTQYASSAACH
jgi:hypothetical protein